MIDSDESGIGWQQEADRQQALLAAIHSGPGRATEVPAGLRQSGDRARRGISVYRANAHALAERALAAAFPTLEKMIGDGEFPAMAQAYWRSHPPICGDIAEWGAALPDWLAARSAESSLADWPWLADAARLDWAVHACERAADAVFDASTLARLAERDPGQLRLELMPGTRLVVSAFPIVTMHAAHHAGDLTQDAAADRFAAVRTALTEGCGEHALVWRRGWRASVCALGSANAAWMADLLSGIDLAMALSRHGEAVDFTAWLQQALLQGWLKGVALRGD